jgi:hypothetical protein
LDGQEVTVRLVDRVMRKTELRGACIAYTGPTEREGYGIVTHGRRQLMVHRVVWQAEHGSIPADFVVHHRCRTKTCVALDHLDAMPRDAHTALHNAERAADNATWRFWAMEAIGRLMRGDCG